MKLSASAWLMLGLLLFGGALLTMGYRAVQNTRYSDVSDELLTDRQRAFVETQTQTSTSLFNVAFAALVGLVGLQIHGKRNQRPSGALPRLAAAFLALSMYASFLFNTQVAWAIGRGPLNLLASPGIDLPLTAQFWLFVIGIVMLLFWVFPSRSIGGVGLAFGLLVPSTASAQNGPVAACAVQWGTDRQIPLTQTSLVRVERIVNGVAGEAKLTLDGSTRCPFVESLLDELRRRVVADAGASVEKPGTALDEAIRLSADTLDSHTFSAGDVITRLVAIAQVWRQPSGLLVVRSAADVLYVIATRVDGAPADWKGITNWTVRVPAGVYRVEVTKDGLRVENPQRIEVKDGDRLELVYPRRKQ
jgi:hypothetical protein